MVEIKIIIREAMRIIEEAEVSIYDI